MNFYTLIKELCLCPSVSGRESAIREKISALISPYCDRISTDALGNLIAVKRGAADGERIMLAAHMDEIGFMVTFIEESGMLRAAPIGGVSLAEYAFTPVVSERGVRGALACKDKCKKLEDVFIDIGAASAKKAEALVKIGDFFVVSPHLEKLSSTRICGRPLDDRIGCAVLLEIARSLANEKLAGDVYYVFSVQEEVGCRGAATAAFAIAPDIALCVDVTATGDTPDAPSMACRLGDGVAVKIKDAGVICSEKVTSALCALAEKNGIKYQREILLQGATDASSMQLAGAGAMVGALSVPTRYIHSPVEVCDIADATAAVRLATEFIKDTGRM